jgi:DNA polymerase-3 subunit gamma/tau
MSYLVLARKYRPRNFAEVVGQEHVVRALTHALEQRRLHHAYLFTGTRGIGKTTISRILAKSLNCVGPDGQGNVTATPCGVCDACKAIDAGRFVDYTELDAASNRGVDEVQALLEQAVYKPVQGRFKVFMIDEVHMLSNTAFNAMLKTLEEPPDYLKFVLATTDPQKVPVTVLSRCLQFNLRPMAPEIVLEQLRHILELEHLAAEPAALALLARAAHGSMRDALSLTDQAIAYGSGELKAAAVQHMLGSASRDVVFGLIAALAAAEGGRVVEWIEQLRVDGQSAAAVLEDMARCLQRMAVRQAAPDVPVDPADPDAEAIARLADVLPADETQLLYSLCVYGRAELGLAPDEYVGLAMALLRLLPFKAGGATPAVASAEKKTAGEPGDQIASRVDEALPAVPHRPPTVRQPAAKRSNGGGSRGARGVGTDRDDAEAKARTRDAARVAPKSMRELATCGVGNADESHRGSRDALQSVSAPSAIPDPEAIHAGIAPEPAIPRGPEAVVSAAADSSGDPSAGTAPAADAPDAQEAGAFWYALVRRLVRGNAIAALSRELALQSELVERAKDHWRLRVENAALQRDAARERLESALAEAGHAVRLTVEVGAVSDSPARRRDAAATRRLEAATAVVMADPFIQEMMQKFGAKIIPGSIQPL